MWCKSCCCCCCCCRRKKEIITDNRNTVDFPIPTVSLTVSNGNQAKRDEEGDFYNGSDSESEFTSISQQLPITSQPLPSIPIQATANNQNTNINSPNSNRTNQNSDNYENLNSQSITSTPINQNPNLQSSPSSSVSTHRGSKVFVFNEGEEVGDKIRLKGTISFNGSPKNVTATIEIDKSDDDSGVSGISNNSYKNYRESFGYVKMSGGYEEEIYVNDKQNGTEVYVNSNQSEAPKVDRRKKPNYEQIKKHSLSTLKKVPKPAPREKEHLYEVLHNYKTENK